MVHAWFVSDIHLTDMSDAKAKIFLAFLQSLKKTRDCTHLFLLGDIFDLWVGDHLYFQNRFAAIISEIQRVESDGVEVHYFEGNHDLHLEKFWGGQLNLHVHTGPIYTSLGNKVFRLEHGDESDPDDKGYIFLRRFLRTSPLKWLSYSLPGGVVSRIGEKASAKSRMYTSEQKTIAPEKAVQKLHQHADRAFQEKAFDILVNGHVHIRDDYRSPQDYRAINLGTWLHQPVALYFNGQDLICEDLSDSPSFSQSDR